jgi:hypothetical protein
MNWREPLPLPAVLALLIGILFRVWSLLATPVASNSTPHQVCSYNDEVAHVNYIACVRQTGILPGHVEAIDAPGALARGQFENFQPPMYYALTAGLAALLDIDFTEVAALTMVGRWLSLFAGIALFLVWLRLAAELDLPPPAVAAGLVFLSLSGPLIRFASTAGNESLCWLTAGLWMLISVRGATRSLSANDVVRVALVLALALWVKLSIVILLPLILWGPLRRRSVIEIAYVVAALLITVLLTAQLWVRNLREFGELLPLAAGFGAPSFALPGLQTAIFAVRSFVNPWWEFWGARDALVLAPFLVWMAWLMIRNFRRLPVIMSAGLVLATLAFIYLNIQFRQAEGRYLLIAWPSVAALVGVPTTTPRVSLWLLFATLIFPYIPIAYDLLGG